MIVVEARASSILYNLLRSLGHDRPFLLPANVCPVVPLTFLKARRRFRFVDIGGGDLAIDQARCLALAGSAPEAVGGIVFVHSYGAEVDVASFFHALKAWQPDLLVIDDRCLCRPEPDGLRLAAGADVTLYSTGRAKHVDLGFGGFAHIEKHVAYRRQGSPYSESVLADVTRRYTAAVASERAFNVGDEAWLDLAPPAVAWDDLRQRVLDGLVEADAHKQRLNAIYTRTLPAEIQMTPRFQHWRFNLLVPEADHLVARLSAEGLFASRHYAPLGRVFGDEDFPEARRLHDRVVNLFNDRSYDEGRAHRTARIVTAHLLAPRRR